MKNQILSESADVSTALMDRDDMVLIPVTELRVSEEICFPVFDKCGLLLLAEGTVLTDRFLDRLKEHGIDEVLMSRDYQAYLDNLKSSDHAGVESPEPDAAVGSSDFELLEKLDTLIAAGALEVENQGPQIRDDINVHRRDLYDAKNCESFTNYHQKTVETLRSLMKDVLAGKTINGGPLLDLAGGFVRFLVRDIDMVLSITSELTKQKSLVHHCTQQAVLGMAIGVEMGMNEENIKNIGLCGLLHDWGMMRVPAEIRDANRALTLTEFQEVKKHSQHAVELLEQVKGLPKFVPLVCFQVHEKPNGTGYPLGRTGETIHLFAKILAVADCYLAMISPRPYRPAVMPYAAMECLLRLANQNAVDADVVRSLLHVQSLFPIGSYVTLSDGSQARSLRRSGDSYMRPVVQITQDYRGCRLDLTDEKSLIELSEDDVSIKLSSGTPGKEEIGLSPAVIEQRRQ